MKKVLFVAVTLVMFVSVGFVNIAQAGFEGKCEYPQWRMDACKAIPAGTGDPKCMFHQWPRDYCEMAPPPPPPPPKRIVMHGIKFDTASAAIKSESYPILEENLAGLEETNRPIVIEGHTDSRGTDAYNQKLSEQRAQSVKSFFVERGIDSSRITAVGMGEGNPIATNNTDYGRAQNRRIEIDFR